MNQAQDITRRVQLTAKHILRVSAYCRININVNQEVVAAEESYDPSYDADSIKSVEYNKSVVSMKTTKTTKSKSGHLHKHCMEEKCCFRRVTGNHWSRHIKDAHQGQVAQFSLCNGAADCELCLKIKGYNGDRKCYKCQGCGKNKRYDLMTEGNIFCKVCDKWIVLKDTGKVLQAIQVEKEDAAADTVSEISLVGSKRSRKERIIVEQALVAAVVREEQQAQPEILIDIVNEGDAPEIAIEEDQLMELAFVNEEQEQQQQQHQVIQEVQEPSPKRQKVDAPIDFMPPPQIEQSPLKEQEQHQQQPQLEDGASLFNSSFTSHTVVFVSHSENEALDIIQELEKSTQPMFMKQQQLQTLSSMLHTELVLLFLSKGEHPALAEIIVEIQSRFKLLDQNQVAGLMMASFVLGNICWEGTVQMLKKMDNTQRIQVFEVFSLHFQKKYKEDLCQWLCRYWRVSEQQHLSLIQYLNQKPTKVNADVLTLSLCVLLNDDIENFVTFASDFVESASIINEMFQGNLEQRERQQKIDFLKFGELTVILQQKINGIIEKIQGQLQETPVCQWKALIEENEMAAVLADAQSIQVFIDELIAVYGEIRHLQHDLTQSDDFRFEMMLNEVERKPNNRQFALAQYITAMLYQAQRQLWVVPSGQGKSRIAASIAALGLMTTMVDKVHLIFDNEQLMMRDKADFEDQWILLGFDAESADAVVCYHVGFDFKVGQNELLIFDEIDSLMFAEPVQFRDFINGHLCLGFTATPDNGDAKGAEAKIIEALGFKRFNYMLNNDEEGAAAVAKETKAAAAAAAALDVDEVVACVSLEEKAQFIIERAAVGPILVFGPLVLIEALKAAGCDPIVVSADSQVDNAALRQLDQMLPEKNGFRVVIGHTQFSMRGIDYRSQKAKLTLIIAQSFENQREALQGFHRVGRFGDNCSRIRFDGVEVLDKKAVLQHKSKLFQFLMQLQKKQLALKQVVVKQPTAPKTSKMGSKRMNALLGNGQQPKNNVATLDSFFQQQN